METSHTPLITDEGRVLVLRAIRTLQAQRAYLSLPTLLAIVPLSPLRVVATVRALDAEGYLDSRGLRLTLRGFVASHAPNVVAFERRRALRSTRASRTAARVA